MVQTGWHSSLRVDATFILWILSVFAICANAPAMEAQAPKPPPVEIKLHPFHEKWAFVPAKSIKSGAALALMHPTVLPAEAADEPIAIGRGRLFKVSVQGNLDSRQPITEVNINPSGAGNPSDYLIVQLGKRGRDLKDEPQSAPQPDGDLIKRITDKLGREKVNELAVLESYDERQMFFASFADGQSILGVNASDGIKTLLTFSSDQKAKIHAWGDLDFNGRPDTFLFEYHNPAELDILGLTPSGVWWRLAPPTPINQEVK